MDLRNDTPFAAGLFGLVLADGAEAVGLAVKGTWTLPEPGSAEPLALAERQQPLRLTPTYAGVPGASSLRYPADVSLPKPGTDCVLVADAVAPGGTAEVVAVRFAVGPVRTAALVFGERSWTRLFGFARPSEPAPFDRLPLVWEHAYGGTDRAPDGSVSGWPSNPVGRGFRTRRSDRALAETPPPRIERPGALVVSPADRPAPVGTLPVAPSWSPRCERAGTYDEAWRRDRAPYLPDDYDPRFACAAPDDLVAVPPLVGDEAVRVEGVRADGPLAFSLPAPALRVTIAEPIRMRDLALALALVVVDVPEGQLTMTWTGVRRMAEGPVIGVRVQTS